MVEAESGTVVSVVLATNRAGTSPYLDLAIDSVLSQSFSEWELVIVDDASPGTEQRNGRTHDDPRIRMIRIESSGVARARNIGVEQSNGSLLAFLDDDDAWHPDRLAHHVSLMTKNPDVAVSYCRMRTIDGSGRELAPGDQVAVHGIHDVYRGTTGILMPNMMVRRDAFAGVGGFDPSIRVAEDLDLLLRMARVGRVAFVDADVLVDYRAHDNNTTGAYREVAKSVRSVVVRYRELAVSAGDRDLAADLAERLKANGRYAAWSAARSARRLIADGRVGAAMAELTWALRFAPDAPFSWLARRVTRMRRRNG